MKWSVVVLVVSIAATPCLWDSDTLDTELRGLPDAFDLVVGRWHRHGDVYYLDRIERIVAVRQPTLAQYDDLAVAREHLGERDQAIAAMARKAEALLATPDEEHQYRYHANLGTLYAHAGRFDDALVELRRAVAINPSAHFGRETFQIELIEYVRAAKAQPELWHRRSFLRHAGYRVQLGLWHTELGWSTDDPAADWNGKRELDWDLAYKAVAGMLRFGGLEGPELYRSLGELFLAKRHLNLAWWSFQRAIERGHPAEAALRKTTRGIEQHWNEARQYESTGHVNPTAKDYTEARAEADRWLQAFQAAESAAISRAEDVYSDAGLQALLAAADQAEPRTRARARAAPSRLDLLVWGAPVVVVLCLSVMIWLRLRAR